MTVITADEILTILWQMLNTSRSRGGPFTGPQLEALKLLMESRGVKQFLITLPEEEIECLLHCLWEFAHAKVENETRAKLKKRAWVTSIALRIMRYRANKTEE